jgi:hypothetical protein
MIKKEVKEIMEQLGKTSYGAALRVYLNEAIADLKDITKTKSWEETLGRQLAVDVLERLMKDMEERQAGVNSKPKFD